jgi:hypothetical protein
MYVKSLYRRDTIHNNRMEFRETDCTYGKWIELALQSLSEHGHGQGEVFSER